MHGCFFLSLLLLLFIHLSTVGPWQISCTGQSHFDFWMCVCVCMACGQINVLLKRDQHVSKVSVAQALRKHTHKYRRIPPIDRARANPKEVNRHTVKKTSRKLIPEYDIYDTLLHVRVALHFSIWFQFDWPYPIHPILRDERNMFFFQFLASLSLNVMFMNANRKRYQNRMAQIWPMSVGVPSSTPVLLVILYPLWSKWKNVNFDISTVSGTQSAVNGMKLEYERNPISFESRHNKHKADFTYFRRNTFIITLFHLQPNSSKISWLKCHRSLWVVFHDKRSVSIL